MRHFYESIDGWYWFENAYARLLDSLPTDRPSTFVEVGVFRGRSLAYLGVEIVNRKLDCQLHAVDNWLNREVRETFLLNIKPLKRPLGARLKVHHLSSVDAALLFPDGSCDVVWLDADHSYDSVRADLVAWWPKVKPGGYLGGDDCVNGVAQAVAELFPTHEIGQGTMHDGGPYPWFLVRKPT